MQNEIKSQPPIKVVVADEKDVFLKRLVDILTKAEITVMNTCGDLKNWDTFINPMDLPDVALLSHHMAEKDSLNRARQLKEKYPTIKLILLTFDHENTRIEGMKRPFVHGIIIKSWLDPKEIAFCVRLANLGYIFYPETKKK